MSRIKRLLLLLLCWLPLCVGAAPDASGLQQAWEAVADARYNDAMALFQRQGQSSEARLGQALAMLNRQPKTQSDVIAARRLCTELVETALPTDAAAQPARYLLGRIAEYHLAAPDYDEASRQYQALYLNFPENELAQHALVRDAMLQLYRVSPSQELQQRFAAFEIQAGRLTHASARRDLHLLLADAASFFDLGLEPQLRHALAAHAAGIQQPMRQLTILVRIAELSRKLGQREQAVRYYQEYLAQPILDNREQLIRERLAGLAASSQP